MMRAERFLPTVFVVDDEEPIRRGLQSMLEAAGFLVQIFESADQFLLSYDPRCPGCAILDIRMPGMNGLELQDYMSETAISLPVIVLTGHGDISMAVRAMESGAVTFLEKPARPDVLIEKVKSALSQDATNRLNHGERDEVYARWQELTVREQQILGLIADGKVPKTIAYALGTKESTVRVQRATIRKKMKADSATDLVRMYLLIEDRIAVD